MILSSIAQVCRVIQLSLFLADALVIACNWASAKIHDKVARYHTKLNVLSIFLFYYLIIAFIPYRWSRLTVMSQKMRLMSFDFKNYVLRTRYTIKTVAFEIYNKKNSPVALVHSEHAVLWTVVDFVQFVY